MKCPGQDMQFWKPGDIYEVACPGCARTVEFFKDDTARRCSHCGHRFANPKMDFGCAAYCPYAEQCIGDLPPEVAAQQTHLLKDKVAVAVKRHFGRDFGRIGHATRLARHAEQLAREENADLAVVLTAAYLLDVEGTVPGADADGGVARAILEGTHARPEMIEAVCALMARHREAGQADSPEERVLRDAVLLAGLEERQRDGRLISGDIRKAVADCLTGTCRRQAAAFEEA